MITSEIINNGIKDALPRDLNIKLYGDSDTYIDAMTDRTRLRTYDNKGEYSPFVWETGRDLQGFHLIGDMIPKNDNNFQNITVDYIYTFVVSASHIELLNNCIRALVSFQPKIELTRINRTLIDVYQKYWHLTNSKNGIDTIPYQYPTIAVEYKVINVPFSGRCINPCNITQTEKLC